MDRCQALTKKKLQCTRPVNNNLYCWQHRNYRDPAPVNAQLSEAVQNFGSLSLNASPSSSQVQIATPSLSRPLQPNGPPRVEPPRVSPAVVRPPRPNSPPRVDSPIVRPPRPNSPPRVSPPVVRPPRPNSPPRVDPPIVRPPRPNSPPAVAPPQIRIHNTQANHRPHRLSLKDLMINLEDEELSTVGSYDELLNRLIVAQSRGRTSYVDLMGGRYRSLDRDQQHVFYRYGQVVPNRKGPLVMGEGELQLERQPSDPPRIILKTKIHPQYKIVEPINDPGKFETRCKGVYLTDPVTLEDLDEMGDPNMIYVDGEQRCYYLPSIIASWEQGLCMYDSESRRVVPSYPRDVHGEFLDPSLVVSVYRTAISRGIDKKEYPMMHLLVENSNFLNDVYRFIQEYERLTQEYDHIHRLHPEDQGLWNRRDLLAYDLLVQIYERYNLKFNGGRKYTNIRSGPGRNGTQIFYQATLVSFLLFHNYNPVAESGDDGNPQNLRWVQGARAETYASPVFQINKRGVKTIIGYEQINLARAFVQEPLPLQG